MAGTPNQALQPTHLPPLRYGKRAAELVRWASQSVRRHML